MEIIANFETRIYEDCLGENLMVSRIYEVEGEEVIEHDDELFDYHKCRFVEKRGNT